MMADDGWRCVTIDVPGRGMTEICFPAAIWAELSGEPDGHMPAPDLLSPALLNAVRSYAAAAAAALDDRPDQ